MSEQIDIAVELRVVAAPLPEILNLRQLVEVAPVPPPQVIEGVMYQGRKMILGGTSKSNKSWCLLGLAVRVDGRQYTLASPKSQVAGSGGGPGPDVFTRLGRR